eukprot:5201667-Karenia_brevis.AAC.1
MEADLLAQDKAEHRRKKAAKLMAALLDGRNDDAAAMADAWNQGEIYQRDQSSSSLVIVISFSPAIYARPGSNVYVFCFLAATLNVWM